MTLSTFAFILSGVLLNAAAQLLLKAGVNAIGAITLDRGTLLLTALRVLNQWPVLAGAGRADAVRGQRGRVDRGALARGRVDYLPDALARLCRQCAGRLVAFGEMIGPLARGRHPADTGWRFPDRPLLTQLPAPLT